MPAGPLLWVLVEQSITMPGQLGRLVADGRHRAGQSQRELAARLGLSQRYLTEIEAGGLGLKVARLLEVLDDLGIELVARPRP